MAKWTAADIPSQTGRVVVITGANSGIGAVTANALVHAGAHVIIACRNVDKGAAAAAAMSGPGSVEVIPLDLADLSSIRSFASGLGPVDILINNAGVMALPLRRTADGFEMQIGTNHLGHFALTGLLLDRLRDRVVTVSSVAHRAGRIDLTDINWERRRYQRWPAYAASKLANLLFTYELQRRVAGSTIRAVAAHPGYAATTLQSHTESIQDWIMSLGNRLIAQPATMGALPTLYAAVTDLPGSTYIGPDGLLEQRGHPKVVHSTRAARNTDTARRLWTLSETLTGITYKPTP